MVEFEARLRSLPLRRGGLALGLWGEPGIGKTHAAQALRRGLPCRSATVQAAAPPGAALLALPAPRRPGAWLEHSLDRLRAGQELRPADLVPAFARLLAANAPFLLHVEDLHGAGADLSGFWQELAGAVLHTRGVGLLVTSRNELPGPFESVRLAALDRAGSDALLEAELGAPLPGEARAWIFGRAAGNPLFTLEYLRFLARRGHAWNDGRAWHWREPEGPALPGAVEALIERALLDATPTPALEEALGARALLGPDATDAVWAGVAGLTPADLGAARAGLERAGALRGGDLAHPLYREVALRRLSPARRQRLARRALAVLREEPREAARFAEDAALAPGERLAWFGRAAGAAREAGNVIQASRWTARAAACASGGQRAALALEAARGLRRHDVPEALRLTGEALAGDPGNAPALDLRAELLAGQGRLAEAEALLEHLPEGERTGLPGAIRRLHLRGGADDTAGVLDLWRAHPDLWPEPDARVAAQVAFALARRDRAGEAWALASRVLARPGLDPGAACDLLNVLGILRYQAGDFAGAAGWYGRALALAEEAGLPHLAAVCRVNRGMTLGELGQHRARVADLEESLRLHTGLGESLAAARAGVAVADARLDLGEYERAEDLLLEARAILAPLGPSDHLIECEYRLGLLYRDWGPPHGGVLALRHAHAALDYARQAGGARKLAWSLSYAAIAEARFGSAPTASALAAEASGVASGLDAPALREMTRFARAHALEAGGERSAALDLFAAVERDLLAQDVEDAAQEVGLEVDRLRGDVPRAARRLAWFEEREMVNLANLVRRAFPELARRAGEVPAPTSRLEVLGPMCFGPPGATRPVRGRRRRELLACLLEARLRGRAEVPRADLLGTLYPGADGEQAAASLKELVHLTRGALGPGAVQTTPGGYALGEVASDAAQFLGGGDSRLWRGPYLGDVAPGVRDETVADALHLALRGCLRAALASDPPEAARLGRLLLEAEPYDREALALTLRALRAGGEHRALGRLYEEARARWREVGEDLPADWSAFLAPVPA